MTKSHTAKKELSEASNTAVINNILLTEYLKSEGVLFNVDAEKAGEGNPVMTGNIVVGDQELQMSCFKTIAESGLTYLALSLGSKDCTHYHGKLFRSENKRSKKSPDFSGFITVLPCDYKEQYTDEQWNEAPQLKVTGWAKRNADGSPRISLTIAPESVMENELPI